MKRIGVLRVVAEDFTEPQRQWKEAFLHALALQGFRDGANVEVHWFEFAAHQDWDDVVPKLAEQMVAARLDCMIASGDILAGHLARATRSVPIVAELNDPVALGFAASLPRPGGNVTGIHRGLEEVSVKRVQFLQSIVPATRSVAWIGFRPSLSFYPTFERAARQGKLAVRKILFEHVDDAAAEALGAEFAHFRREGCLAAHIFTSSPRLIEAAGALALKHRIALSHPTAADIDGVLFSYSPVGNSSLTLARLTEAIARILRGERPGDIAIVGPTRYELTLNQRTAARIGVSFPQGMVVLADRVIAEKR